MNDQDRIFEEIERLYDKEEEKRQDALTEQAIAADMKAEAIKKEKAAKAVIRELSAAKLHFEKAYSFNSETSESEEVAPEVEDSHMADEEIIVEERKTSSKGLVTGLIIGATAIAILAGSIKLIKQSKTGDVKVSTSTVGMNDTVKDEPEDVSRDNTGIQYISGDNVVIVSADDNNLVEYEELSSENFEKLVADYVSKYSGQYTNVSTADITKFAIIANIDLLAEENPELLRANAEIQTKEEYLNDAAKLIGATVMNNFNVWNSTKSTEDFIRVSDIVYGEQKQQMLKIEEYVDRIADAANMDDADLVNEIVSDFILDMNSGDLSKLDDGVGFVAQVNIAMISDGIARNYLNKQNFDMLQILKTSEKYVSNIFTEYDKCLGSKTLTR